MPVSAGSTLSCTNTDCPCSLVVQVPCPHGDDFVCGCGHALVPAADIDGDAHAIPPTPGA